MLFATNLNSISYFLIPILMGSLICSNVRGIVKRNQIAELYIYITPKILKTFTILLQFRETKII
jgi:hypothetical protein